MEYDLNEPVLLGSDVIKVTDNTNINVGLYEKRKDVFYDVMLNLPDKNIFIGRFMKTNDNFCVKCKDGKILVCLEKYIKSISEMKIAKVLSLYEILDDTFYSVSEEEALYIFDESYDSDYLEDKDNYIYRSDIEKKKRILIN